MSNQSKAGSIRLSNLYPILSVKNTIVFSFVGFFTVFAIYFVFKFEFNYQSPTIVDNHSVKILSPDYMSGSGSLRMLNPVPVYSSTPVKIEDFKVNSSVASSHGLVANFSGASQFIFSPVVLYGFPFSHLSADKSGDVDAEIRLAVAKDCQKRKGCERNPAEMNRRVQEQKMRGISR